MLKKTVTILLALSAITLTQTANADDVSAPAMKRSVNVVTSHAVKMPLEASTRKKVTRRIVAATRSKAPSQATRAKSQGRFVIGTDHSNKAMTVYRSKNTRKAMPNLFKN